MPGVAGICSGLLIEELLGFAVEMVAECMGTEVSWKFLGWIGAGTALVLTWGRADWEIDEWRSMILGFVVVVTGICLVVGGLMHLGGSTV